MPSFTPENEVRSQKGHTLVAGIDEAGRGPLAGPVTAAVVLFPKDYSPSWLTALDDSKKLTEKKREMLYERIVEDDQLSWGVAHCSVKEIDTHNILGATHRAMAKAASSLIPEAEFYLIDGRPVPHFPFPSQGLVKGDTKSYSIAAASILAKVSRDKIMMEIAEEYPQYHFHKHKGYGTKLHLEALAEHGPCLHHRLSFRPVQEASRPKTGSSPVETGSDLEQRY